MDEAKLKARTTYKAAAEFFDDDALGFWDRFGRATLDDPAESFDAVVIVFGIFVLPDMTAATRGLWRMVKPGGQLAITTWGPHLFEPATSLFWNAVAAVRPDLTRAYNPWDSLTEPEAVRSLLLDAGATVAQAEPVSGTHPLRSRDDFWTIVLGSGYRATYDAMTSVEQDAVRARTLNSLTKHVVTNVQTNVVYATATKLSPAQDGMHT